MSVRELHTSSVDHLARREDHEAHSEDDLLDSGVLLLLLDPVRGHPSVVPLRCQVSRISGHSPEIRLRISFFLSYFSSSCSCSPFSTPVSTPLCTAATPLISKGL
ncbi:hypothetical protein CDAR_521411 [Caerostris darwini]|uniref:Uncharacterized protein n=1 Tax=Caerostris darwini TaxID=1538125 RepID=A0AAV4MGH8_9ARAC|nr:hypothetical protein CDAR_521411 [Caerostris darwini]